MTLTELEHRVVVLKTCLKMDIEQISKAMSKTSPEINEIISTIIKKLQTDSTPEWMICTMLNITSDQIHSYLVTEQPSDFVSPSEKEIALESKVMYLEYKIARIEEHLRLSNIYIPEI
jgi:hypothetical protein